MEEKKKCRIIIAGGRHFQDYDMLRAQVMSVFEKNGVHESVVLQDSWSLIDQLVLSVWLKVVFIFDDNISEKSRNLYKCMGWKIFDFKWTDCILNPEVEEQKIVDWLKENELR